MTRSEIARALDCSPTNVKRHLTSLEKQNLVKKVKDDRKTFYFLAEHTGMDIRLLPYFRDPRALRVIERLVDQSGGVPSLNSLKDVAKSSHGYVSTLVGKLQAKELVQKSGSIQCFTVKATKQLITIYQRYKTSPWATAPLPEDLVKRYRNDPSTQEEDEMTQPETEGAYTADCHPVPIEAGKSDEPPFS